MAINSNESQNVEDYLNSLGLLEEKIEEPTTIISDQLSVVNEDLPAVNSVEEYLGTVLPTSEVDLSTIPTSRKISYGMEQETTLGYNAYRYASAALDAFLNDGDTEVNLLNAEILRQKEIDEKYPEFIGLRADQEDMAITGGRLSQNVFDPSYALFPWARVAAVGLKAGRTGQIAASATLGGTVTGTESAIRQKVIEGDVDLRQVGIEAGLGFVGTAGADIIGTSIGLFKGRSAATKETKDLVTDLKNPAETKPTFGSPIADFADQATYDKLSGTEAGNLTAALNNVTESVGESNLNKMGLDVRELAGAISIHNKSLKSITALKKQLKTVTGNKKEQTKLALKKARETEKLLKQDLIKRVASNIEDTTSVNMQVIEELAQKGGLTQNIYRSVMGQVTRPIFGAIGGGVIGNMFDEDGTHDYLYYGMMLGAGVGVFQKRIQNSKKLTSLQKEEGLLVLDEALLEGISHQVNNLKSVTATTVASKMDALGGIAKVIGNRLFSRFGSATDSVEARVSRLQADYLKSLYTIEGMEVSPVTSYFSDVSKAAKNLFLAKSSLAETEQNNIAIIVGELMNGFVDINAIKPGYKGLAGTLKNVTAEQIEKAKKALPVFQNIQEGIKNSVSEVDIDFKELDNYGLTQVFNNVKIQENLPAFISDLQEAIKIQVKNKGKRLDADDFAASVAGRTPYIYKNSDSVFSRSDKKVTFRGTADYFENQRQLTDFEARKFLASKGWIDLNAQEALATYGTNTIKVVEFSRTFGPDGALINDLLKKVYDTFEKKQRGVSQEKYNALDNAREKYVDTITNGIEAYWGVYGTPAGKGSEYLVRTLQAVGNMSYLTTVSIANLPDLLQPFVNSGFGTAAKQLVKNFKPDERFSTIGSFKYDKSFERELTQLFSSESLSKYGDQLSKIQELYFSAVGLKKVTNVARNFAYDVGVSRAYTLAKKSKGDRTNLNRTELKELEQFGLNATDSADLKEILKHDTALDAFKDKKAQVFLDIAGRKAADRDAIIPLIGNRLVFSQSKNPYMRAIGQFMSWAMAKSSQLNSMVTRIEDGDAKLALNMAAAIPFYMGIKELKTLVSPGERPEAEEKEDYVNLMADGIRISGQASNVFIDKIADTIKYNLGGREDTAVVEGLSPSVALINAFGRALRDSAMDIEANDKEGALKEILDEVPLVSQALQYYKKFTGEDLIEDKPNTPTKRSSEVGFAEGGRVTYPNLVPNAPLEPDERIDKMTGLPYDVQAGIPFIDEEDPLKRLGLVGGGRIVTDPMQRLGFTKRTTL